MIYKCKYIQLTCTCYTSHCFTILCFIQFVLLQYLYKKYIYIKRKKEVGQLMQSVNCSQLAKQCSYLFHNRKEKAAKWVCWSG